MAIYENDPFFNDGPTEEAVNEVPVDPREKIAALKKRKAEIEAYAGTDAWVAADRDLVERLSHEIKALEEDLKKAA